MSMREFLSKTAVLRFLPWFVSLFVAALAVYVWGHSLGWQFAHLSLYALFPLFGLLAWSLMWSHYMAGLMQRTFLRAAELQNYYRWTSYVVLAALLLHPGLLAYQRFRDGFGLPPGSETSYVAAGMGWVVLLGVVCWLTFLSYESRRWFRQRRWWKYIVYAGDVAMFGIFYHSLRLGTQLHIIWFRYVWWFYGFCLAVALTYAYLFAKDGRIKSQASE